MGGELKMPLKKITDLKEFQFGRFGFRGNFTTISV